MDDTQCRAVSLLLAGAPRSPEVTRRFALLDRCSPAAIQAAGDSWERLADIAAGLRPTAAPPRRGPAPSKGHRLSSWGPLAWEILGALPGRLAHVSRHCARHEAQVDRVLRALVELGAVDRVGKIWHAVQHPRPW